MTNKQRHKRDLAQSNRRLRIRETAAQFCQTPQNLKDNHNFSSVYVKKDKRPAERREWGRLRRVYRGERAKPDSKERNVTMALKKSLCDGGRCSGIHI